MSELAYLYDLLAKGYSGEWVLRELSRLVRSQKLATAKEREGVTEKVASLRYAVQLGGGLGDMLVCARFVRDLQSAFAGAAQVDVYIDGVPSEQVGFLFAALEGVGGVHPHTLLNYNKGDYDFILVCATCVSFDEEHIKWERIMACEGARQLVCSIHSAIVRIWHVVEPYIRNAPCLDGAYAHKEVFRGRTRRKSLHAMSGIAYGGDHYPMSLPARPVELAGRRYITLNDGWGKNSGAQMERLTKSVRFEFWNELVVLIKSAFPDILVVQIGGGFGKNIDGVDLNYRGMANFQSSLAVLAGSMLHLDIEGGLVHYAAALGVKSVVMFGPTNIGWFGYPQNLNVPPAACGNCWWTTREWYNQCPAGHEQPVCMEHSAISIFESVARELKVLSGSSECEHMFVAQ
ncbi:hypothetical protein HW090_04410 [Pseudomonas sp. ABC1]|uniref:glycosyltransferase family 9 protein n=1 Tax=Pseudomonas sp. ABC1 TaxID=2748080 RepID=UPI0015C2E80B|nr:hypothetical protein [Pseudomonas sp. ABC1]QLF92475.1 hypothetical protein HW090_04410 [Pseudomonas sp. ABC1]